MEPSATTHAVQALPSTTDSWVYLFSKFTHEAMLFEALALFLGIFGYAIFYLIQKRKYGVAGKEIQSSIIKVYLAQLVADAEEMRIQLFGLLGKGEATGKLLAGLQFQAGDFAHVTEAPGSGATAAGVPVPAPQLVTDPQLGNKLKELEKKLADQATALDSVLNEKMKLEEELANAKANDKAAPGGPDKSGALNERVKQLESQLAEYAIIEDDLANLKRLQKENKTLKQQLADVADKGPATKPGTPDLPNFDTKPAAPDAKAATPDAKPADKAAAAAPDLDFGGKKDDAAKSPDAKAAAPDLDLGKGGDPAAADKKEKAAAAEAPNLDTKAEPAAPNSPEAAKAAAPDLDLGKSDDKKEAQAAKLDAAAPNSPDIATEEVAPNAANDGEPAADFEALVDVVEKNLADAAKSENVAPNTDAAAPDFKLESGPVSEQKPDEKTEEQLQADFEKMLNS